MLFGKKQACPNWYLWLVLIVGIILALSEMGFVNLMGLSWGPVAIILAALGYLITNQ